MHKDRVIPVVMNPVDKIRLGHAEFVAKESYLTRTISGLGVKIVDDLQGCIFCQVLRTGHGLRDNKNISPGRVIVIHKNGGILLERLSKEKGVRHFVIHETNVVANIFIRKSSGKSVLNSTQPHLKFNYLLKKYTSRTYKNKI